MNGEGKFAISTPHYVSNVGLATLTWYDVSSPELKITVTVVFVIFKILNSIKI